MSRDIKSTDITGINDGLDRAINRLHRQMRTEMAESVRISAEETANLIEELKEEVQQGYSEVYQEELRQRMEEIQEEFGIQLDDQAQELNQRFLENEAKYADALQQMSDSIYDSMREEHKRLSNQMQEWLDEQESAFAEQLDDVYATVEEQQEQIEALTENLARFQEDVSQFQEDVSHQFEMQQKQIDTLHREVKTLFEMQANEQNKKLLAAGRALALLEAVRKRTPVVNRFASQERREMVELLENRIRGLKSNPDACGPDDVNRLVDETIVMEREALREQAKWRAKQNQAMTAVNALICRVKMKLEIDTGSLYEGIQKSIILNPDYWTHGRYNELKNRLDEIKKTIESGNADITELDALIREMKELEKKLDCLRKEAANAGILSESRIKMTKDIVKAMKKASWKVKKEDVSFMGGDVDEDEREGTFAILHHPVLGDTLSVIIFPDALRGDEVVNKIVFHRNNETPESEANFQERLRQIKTEIESMTKYRLGELHAPSRGGDGQIEKARSSAELKRKGTAKTMEQLRK